MKDEIMSVEELVHVKFLQAVRGLEEATVHATEKS